MLKPLFLVTALYSMSSARASCYSATCMNLASEFAEGVALIYKSPEDKQGQLRQHKSALCANCVSMTTFTAGGLVLLLCMKPSIGCAAATKSLMACNGGCCIGCSAHTCMHMQRIKRAIAAEERQAESPTTALVSTSLYEPPGPHTETAALQK